MSQAVLTEPLERSTGPYQRSLLCDPDPQCQTAQVHVAHWTAGDIVLSYDIADLSDHCPVIPLQTLEVWLCQLSSLTGMEHCALHTRDIHVAMCLERGVGGRENW